MLSKLLLPQGGAGLGDVEAEARESSSLRTKGWAYQEWRHPGDTGSLSFPGPQFPSLLTPLPHTFHVVRTNENM